MTINQTYDETAGHRVIVATMAEGRPLLRAAALGAYVELVSVMQRNVKASLEQGMAPGQIDTRISVGDIIAIEPWAYADLASAMVKHGLLAAPDVDGRYRLIEHPKLIGWDSPEQMWWVKERRRDTRDPAIILLVRARDGDQCRVCHALVNWGKSNTDPSGGTLDHVDPRTPAGGNPEALAVACRKCNGIRSDRRDADEFAPHQPVPARPFYTESTVNFLRANGQTTYPDGAPLLRATGQKWLLPRIQITSRPGNQSENATEAKRPGSQPDTATSSCDPAASGTPQTSTTTSVATAVAECPTSQRPGNQSDNAEPRPRTGLQPVPEAPECDPATSGTTHQSEPSQNHARTPKEPRGFSHPHPPPPRTKQVSEPGGLPWGEGKEREGLGRAGPGREVSARPSRRGRRGHHLSGKEIS